VPLRRQSGSVTIMQLSSSVESPSLTDFSFSTHAKLLHVIAVIEATFCHQHRIPAMMRDRGGGRRQCRSRGTAARRPRASPET